MDRSIKMWFNSPNYLLANTLNTKDDNGYPTNFISISKTKLLASYSSGKLIIWDIDKLKEIKMIDGFLSPSPDGLYLKDNNTLLIGGKGIIWIYDLKEDIVDKKKVMNKLGLIKKFSNVNEGGFICLCENDICNFNSNLNAISIKNGFKGDFVTLKEESCIISLEDGYVNIWKC